MAGKTLYDKLWDMHLVKQRDDGSALIYIDRHILHEVTSPQAFEGLRLAGRKPWRIDANIATPDHNVPTTRTERKGGIAAIADEVSRLQVQTLDENCDDFGITEFKMNDVRQGIVHVVGPEQGATLPGMTVVCGDSHTSTHGAFGALAPRHRHFRGRACAGDPVPGGEEDEEHAGQRSKAGCRPASRRRISSSR